jgi:hypothetical protein
MPQWIVIAVEHSVFWPTQETKVEFRGRELVLRPETDNFAPDVITAYAPPGSYEEALRAIRNFLSSLAWVRRGKIREIMITGGSHPIHCGKGREARLIDPKFRIDYLPDPTESRTRLALAFYREALGIDNISYQFLGFFKIINVLHEKGPAQKMWINRSIDKLDDHLAKPRILELKNSGVDIGHYLYESGRCAVAHAYAEPLVDPEDPKANARLQKDLPVIKALAEHLIESELGIKSTNTIWREHLYELEGFRILLGSEILEKLKKGETLEPGIIPALPKISIRLYDHSRLPAFEAMKPEIIAIEKGCIMLDCHSSDNLAHMRLLLDFSAERLGFDAEKGVTIADNGSSKSLFYAADHGRLMKGLCLNGVLEVWNSTTEKMLGHTDPFMAVNIDLGTSVKNLEHRIQDLEQLAQKRDMPRSTE